MSALQTYLSHPRLSSYMKEAESNPNLALRLYRWNAQLCEALYIPSQMVEIGFRNRLNQVLASRFSPSWPLQYASSSLQALPNQAKDLIKDAAENLRPEVRTVDRIVAKLTIGFWCRMLDRRYQNVLWQKGLHYWFPGMSEDVHLSEFQDWMATIRDFRNRIAHHEPIFNKDPEMHFYLMLAIIGFICPDSYEFTKNMSDDFSRVLRAKPR